MRIYFFETKVFGLKDNINHSFSPKRDNFHYFTIRGGSLKKIAKKIIPNVPINKKV